ncbi:MAG: phosphoribosylglycinamide formyltransferase [Nitrospinaceae bacterium]|nr:phosphoribosylglycinamide formyltransferase [Nitrospinaceae bacterium]NIR55079.1 phosphoribosylglycinamide formyltransferase [Nitrospinaceae bacterium]NIS85488.1 phosphoribosylglycinamide formyltransferase [Nitrospinaceae bacterium]NIT82326.1 phosphoribosylglycinamide formyltransferase [Nitrospinaceae bacterium]NIU44544.1 phosphoribosylglycinamide formyltransferase [Nitrospinaceae bacterium]
MESREFKLAVLVSGRGTNLQAIIDSIEKSELPAMLAVVVSDVEEAFALERARQHGIESVFLDPKAFSGKEAFDRALVERLREKSVDLVCLAGFMRLLGKPFLEAFPRKIINIHPSLLPAFPGLHPQRQALEHGVKFSGCTVHFVDEGVDSGPIILQSVVPVYDDDDVESLSQRILQEEHLLYPRAIRLCLENRLEFSGRRVFQKKD